ncbi:MAG: MarR family transcriptional regulator [Myxococcaceae bacterium]|nr:MarR family transcriptional regulator [Myxococcaceae bacterium]
MRNKAFNPNRPGPPALPSEALALVAACRALYDAIDRLDAEASASVDLWRSDLRALNLLERGPVKAKQLATALGLTAGGVTALIDRLEARGLARREDDPDDRRGTVVAPTPRMFQSLGPLYRGVAERIAALAQRYGPSEAARATVHVRDVVEAYAAALAPSRDTLDTVVPERSPSLRRRRGVQLRR